jgi:hypothetical protein
MNVGLINLNFNASSRLFQEKLLALFSFVSTKEKVWQDFLNSIKGALKTRKVPGILLYHKIECSIATSQL